MLHPLDPPARGKDAGASARRPATRGAPVHYGWSVLSEEALWSCLESHLDRFYRIAFSITGNHHDAEDAVQDAALKAIAARESFRGEADPRTWVHRILINAANDRVVRRGRELRHPEIERIAACWRDEHYTVDPGEIATALADGSIGAALERLSSVQRTVVVLHDAEQWTSAEIARQLDMPLATVKSHLRRGRHSLVSLLAGGRP